MNSKKAENSELKSLLHQWKLSHLLNYFIAQDIDLEILKIIKIQHVYELLKNFTLGDRIRFEHELEKFRITVGKPLESVFLGPMMSPPIEVPHEMITKIPATQQCKEIETQTDFPEENILPKETEKTDKNKDNLLPQPPLLTKPLTPPLLRPKPVPAKISLPVPAKISRPVPLRKTLPRTRKFALTDSVKGSMRKWTARYILEHGGDSRGPELIKNYAINGCFNPNERLEVINIIALFFYDNGIHLHVKMCYELERQLLKLFPGERLKDYRTEKRGKIYIRLSNIKNHRRRAKEAKASKVYKEEKQLENSNSTSMDLGPENENINNFKDNEMDNNFGSPQLSIFVNDIKQENDEREYEI